MREVDAASGRWRAPRAPMDAWKPPSRFVEPSPPPVYSRWVKSALSVGPVGRVAITVGILLFDALAIVASPSPGSGLIFTVVSWWVLKDVWKPVRVTAPQQQPLRDRAPGRAGSRASLPAVARVTDPVP